jgi:hypothetical protein
MNFHHNLPTSSVIDELQVVAFIVFCFIKEVNIDPTEFELQPGQSQEVTLQFQVHSSADPLLLPIYSGFIYVTNEVNGEIAHMSCKYSFLLVHFNSIFMNIYASFYRCWCCG